MKRLVILIAFLIGNFSLETHDLNIKDYSSSDDWAVLVSNVANHYNQDFWLIKDIFDICLGYNVDPLLMISLIKIESDFNPTALSRKNAYGYCQITPIANKDVDPKLNRYKKRENIILGVRFINKLLGLELTLCNLAANKDKFCLLKIRCFFVKNRCDACLFYLIGISAAF